MLKQLIHDKINEIFLEMQNAEGITDGGIDPFDAMYLDQLEEQLEQHIARIIKYQKGGIQMEKGQLIVVNGRIYEYDRYDKHLDVHFVAGIEIDEEGILTHTHIPCFFSTVKLAEGFNKTNFTEDQWYGIVAHIIRNNHDVTEEEITEATEDIVGRCFVMNMPQFNELEEYIACYMNR